MIEYDPRQRERHTAPVSPERSSVVRWDDFLEYVREKREEAIGNLSSAPPDRVQFLLGQVALWNDLLNLRETMTLIDMTKERGP